MLLYVYVLYNNLNSIIEHFPIKEGSKTNLFRKLKPLKALKNSIYLSISICLREGKDDPHGRSNKERFKK